jgi:signal transduction histidine kinase
VTALMQDRWLALFLLCRGLAAAAAVGLLLAHRVTDHDGALLAGALVAGPVAMLVAARSQGARRSPSAWLADAALALGLVVASEDWRSAFYLLALTTLILPAVSLPRRRATAWGVLFAAAYLGVAALTGLEARTLGSTIRLETLATHVLVPVLIVLALSYAADLLGRLRHEERRARELAVEAERRRIAWELHDSAKQRVHAAHLLLTAARDQANGDHSTPTDQALAELQAATADLDTSVRELQAPLAGRGLDVAVRRRVEDLRSMSRAEIVVRGTAAEVPETITAHAYRIVAEAVLNAVRHADAERISVRLARDDNSLRITVSDDGRGLPRQRRPGSHGLSFMRHRAARIGGRLDLTTGPRGRGTVVVLDVPLDQEQTT